jgi:hypothetical protein
MGEACLLSKPVQAYALLNGLCNLPRLNPRGGAGVIFDGGEKKKKKKEASAMVPSMPVMHIFPISSAP